MHIACQPTGHRHPQRCIGCRCPVAPDEVVVTSTGRYGLCGSCYDARRRSWLASSRKAGVA